MGTQTAIAAQIVEAGGDDTLSLKDNQATMHEQAKEFFETAQETGFKNVTVEHRREIDGEHGRIETRDYWLTPLPEYFSGTNPSAGSGQGNGRDSRG